jgi:hypothetical protein
MEQATDVSLRLNMTLGTQHDTSMEQVTDVSLPGTSPSGCPVQHDKPATYAYVWQFNL